MAKTKIERARRLEILATHPGVKWHSRPTPCSAVMTNRTLKAVFGTPAERAARTRSCRNPAHWTFTALRSRDEWSFAARDGDYCYSHLIHHGIRSTPEEDARTRRWITRLEKLGKLPLN